MDVRSRATSPRDVDPTSIYVRLKYPDIWMNNSSSSVESGGVGRRCSFRVRFYVKQHQGD